MKKIFYILTALAICLLLCVGVSAETGTETLELITDAYTVAQTEEVTDEARESAEAGLVTEAERETEAGVGAEATEATETEATESERSDTEKAYWAALWGQVTGWFNGHLDVVAFLTAATGFIGSIVVLCKHGEKLIKMALALRREGDEKNAVIQKKMEAIAEENGAAQKRALVAEEKLAKAVAVMALCVERLIEESNLPTYKKDEIRSEFKKAVGGDGDEGGDQA